MEVQNSERKNVPTLNGGAYSITHFYDQNKQPIQKELAVRHEVFEYDQRDQVIARSYFVPKPNT